MRLTKKLLRKGSLTEGEILIYYLYVDAQRWVIEVYTAAYSGKKYVTIEEAWDIPYPGHVEIEHKGTINRFFRMVMSYRLTGKNRYIGVKRGHTL